MKQNIDDLKKHGFEIIDKEENQKIISKYVNEKTMFQVLLELINQNKIEDAYKLIQKWFNFIKSKFESDKVIDNLTALAIMILLC